MVPLGCLEKYNIFPSSPLMHCLSQQALPLTSTPSLLHSSPVPFPPFNHLPINVGWQINYALCIAAAPPSCNSIIKLKWDIVYRAHTSYSPIPLLQPLLFAPPPTNVCCNCKHRNWKFRIIKWFPFLHFVCACCVFVFTFGCKTILQIVIDNLCLLFSYVVFYTPLSPFPFPCGVCADKWKPMRANEAE